MFPLLLLAPFRWTGGRGSDPPSTEMIFRVYWVPSPERSKCPRKMQLLIRQERSFTIVSVIFLQPRMERLVSLWGCSSVSLLLRFSLYGLRSPADIVRSFQTADHFIRKTRDLRMAQEPRKRPSTACQTRTCAKRASPRRGVLVAFLLRRKPKSTRRESCFVVIFARNKQKF